MFIETMLKSLQLGRGGVMRNVLLGISILALLIGCSSKEEKRFLKIYEKKIIEDIENRGEYTKNCVFLDKNTLKIS